MLISVEPQPFLLADKDVQSDRRHDVRQPRSSGLVTLTESCGTANTGTVINESFGGLGIVFDIIVPISRGLTIQVCYHGAMANAVARHVTAFDGGGCLVGLQWQSVHVAETMRPLAALHQRATMDAQLEEFLSQFLGTQELIRQLVETGNWIVLAEMVVRLSDSASQAGVFIADGCLDALLQLLEETPQSVAVEQSVNQLMAEIADQVAKLANHS